MNIEPLFPAIFTPIIFAARWEVGQKVHTPAISCQGLTLISGACEGAKKAALFPATFRHTERGGQGGRPACLNQPILETTREAVQVIHDPDQGAI